LFLQLSQQTLRHSITTHQIKNAKRKLAQSKTILTERLNKLERTKANAFVNLIEKQDYLKGNF
jgi:hypothetical protein